MVKMVIKIGLGLYFIWEKQGATNTRPSLSQTLADILSNARCYPFKRLPLSSDATSRILATTMEATMEPSPITALIDCSPFGLFCRDCKVAFSCNKSAQNHLRLNHRDAIKSTNWAAVHKFFKELQENGNTLSVDEWLVGEPKNGGECAACREFIPLK